MKRVVCLLILAAACGGKHRDKSKKPKDPEIEGMRTEAKLMLKRLEKAMKRYAAETGGVPPAVVTLTPGSPCCRAPNGTCPADDPAWNAEPWTTLDFSIEEPHHFQYSYDSDGKTFTSTAVTDLDCNGHTLTLTLHGAVDADSNLTAAMEMQ